MLYNTYSIKLIFLNILIPIISGGSSVAKNVWFQPSIEERNMSLQVKVLAFDFDKTCTMEIVLDIYKAREDYSIRKDALDREFGEAQQFYESILKKILMPLKDMKQAAKQFDEEGLQHFLTEVGAGDTLTMEYVIDSKILQGITANKLEDFAKTVQLKPGLLRVLQSLETLNLPFHVISLNFSEKLIQYVLNRDGTLPIEVHSNKLLFKNGISTGNMDTDFITAHDKEKQLEEIIQSAGNKNGVTIYIGDSFADLLALLKADVGIIIGKSQSMLKVCNDFGIPIVPLAEWTLGKSSDGLNKVLFSVNSWDEIKNFIFGNIETA